MKCLDILLLIIIISLVAFGLLMIYDASSYTAFKDFGDKYHFIRDQFQWALLGFGFLTFFTFFDYRRLYSLALPILITAIALLLCVLIPGIGVSLQGARRWIATPFFFLQPTEFVKLALAIYLSAWFSQKEKGRLTAFFLLIGFVLLLIMVQPDMGTAVVILFEALIAYFISGGSIGIFGLLLPVIGFVGFFLIKIEPYRAERLVAFFNTEKAIQTSYHVRQILIALGSGGMTGVGFGNSLQKYGYLPESTTDSIFAIIAEEVGFFGSVMLIIVFAILVWRGFYIAMRAKDPFGKLLAGSIITFLGIQIIVNLAAMTVLVPLTGIPLPFISYGGSALVVDLSAIGILLSIARISEIKLKR